MRRGHVRLQQAFDLHPEQALEKNLIYIVSPQLKRISESIELCKNHNYTPGAA